MFALIATALAATPGQNLTNHAPASIFGLDAGITPRLPRNPRPTQYFIDQFGPSAQPFRKTAEIRAGQDVTVRGWAIDAPADALAGGVEIVVDGHAYKLPYFLSRADVAAAKRKEAYTDCGFLGIVSAELLPKGSHTVSLRIVSADRKTYYQSPEFHVLVRNLPDQMTRNASGLDAGITPRLPQGSKPTQYFVDQFGPSVQPFGKTVEIRSGQDVMVRGWAIDASVASLAGGVEIVIDDHAFKLPYFLSRADVATALKTETYMDCGFSGIVPPELLPKGSHTVSLRIVSADRKTYYQTPSFRIVVQPT